MPVLITIINHALRGFFVDRLLDCVTTLITIDSKNRNEKQIFTQSKISLICVPRRPFPMSRQSWLGTLR